MGTMNDLAFRAEAVIADTGGLSRCHIVAVNHDLSRTIDSVSGLSADRAHQEAGGHITHDRV